MRSPDRHPSRWLRSCVPTGLGSLVLFLALVGPSATREALAQDKPAEKAADLFDEEPKAEEKKADEKKPTEKAADVFDEAPKSGEKKPVEPGKPADPAQPPAGGAVDRDSIGFTQENAAAQMTELEERMFRLSEALRSLEPENASRLGLALKFSREELILNQMKQTHTLLKDAQLAKAETEVRELLAKLGHLRNLLLAEDLDFQMKLARLRQMREAIAQIDRIIKEEKRELAWSRNADQNQADLEKFRESLPALEKLVQSQGDLIRETKEVAQADGDEAKKAARQAGHDREAEIQATAAGLAESPAFAGLDPPHLKRADPHLADAVTHLGTADSDAAIEPEGEALDLFRKELDRLKERTAEAEKAIADEEFRRFEQDQARNRQATDKLAEVSARLGDTGIALQKDLIRASAPMESAVGDLAKTKAKPAAEDQLAALKHLEKARGDLGKSLEGLLVELRSELATRIIADLTEMHETQTTIRETTEGQAPRIAQKSRAAFILVAGQSPMEAELADRADELVALTEETEFGIALPTALRVISRQMRSIQGWLKEGDASPRTIDQEKRVEQDLLGLLEAMRRLPPTTPPAPGTPLPSELGARERELNRLIAELKMIRLLQVRLDDDTVQLDQNRPDATVLPPALRREIETLKSGQDEIHDSLSKIAEKLEPPQDLEAVPDPFRLDP
ncbi:DUF4175 family protein [Tundrisphaera lichenicola]|uniref:DUF4175 family protein n=1 Tax=Tundrisphaera lichenicola TaxID=2029860 RepID=UPI003EB9E210